MSVIRPLDVETGSATKILDSQYKKVDSIESKRSVTANRGTPVSERQKLEISFMVYIQQVISLRISSLDGFETYQVANPEGLLDKVTYDDKFPDDNLIRKESAFSPSVFEPSFLNNYFSKILPNTIINSDTIEKSTHSEEKLAKGTRTSYKEFKTSSNILEISAHQNSLDKLFYSQLIMKLRHKSSEKSNAKMAEFIAKTLRPGLEASSALEAAIAFPDPTLLEQLSLEELAELQINGPEDFCLFILTEAEGYYFDLVYSFTPVLDLVEDFDWSPSIEVFTVAQAKEAGGLENLAKSWSPLVHSIFHR